MTSHAASIIPRGISSLRDNHDIGELLKELSAASGYVINDHRLDLYGLCPECASRKS